jgi:hypothetical protein
MAGQLKKKKLKENIEKKWEEMEKKNRRGYIEKNKRKGGELNY